MISKPSLRNYAVIRRLESHFWGSVWSVLDRRTGTNAYLYKPSLLVSWPRLYAALAEFNPIPLRLRNSKVVILSQQVVGSKTGVSKALWSPVHKSELNSTSGISQVKSYRKIALFSLLVLSGLALHSISVKQNTVAETSKEKSICGADLSARSRFQLNSKFEIGRDQYKLLSTRSVGGYRVIKAQRVCDSKTLNFSAWYAGDYLEISKVY